MSAPQRRDRDTELVPRRENNLGQQMRRKGEATRLNLMHATLELLADHSPMSLSVHGIARQASTSPGTFYIYFKSVKEVIFALVESLNDRYLRDVLPTVQKKWTAPYEPQVREFVLAYFAFCTEHRRLLAVRNLEADLGDTEFISQRIDMARPVVDALCDRFREAAPRRSVRRSQPWAQAVVCCGAIEEMFSYPSEAYRPDVPIQPDDVVQAQVNIICGLLERGGGKSGG